MSTPTTDSPPTLLVSWAHDPNEGVGREEWRQQVLQLTVALRHFGVDAEVDLFHQHDRGIDWTTWGPQQLAGRQITLAVVNRAWRHRFDGTNDPRVGAGAAAEAAVLHGLLSEDQQAFRDRLLIAVLPGAGERDVPLQLRGLQRVHLKGFGQDDLDDLLRLIFDEPAVGVPPVGGRPTPLPSEQLRNTLAYVEQRREAGSDGTEADRELVSSTADVLTAVLEVAASEKSGSSSSDPERIGEALGSLTGTGRHAVQSNSDISSPVPGVPADGQETVQRQLAINPAGSVVRHLLTELAEWPGLSVDGIRRRGAGPDDSADYTQYVRISGPKAAIGYLYVASGRLNPKVSSETLDQLESLAPHARRISSSNPGFRAVIQVNDDEALQEAFALLRRAADNL